MINLNHCHHYKSLVRGLPHLQPLSRVWYRYTSQVAGYRLSRNITSAPSPAGRYFWRISSACQTARPLKFPAYATMVDAVQPSGEQFGICRAEFLQRDLQPFRQTSQSMLPQKAGSVETTSRRAERDIQRLIDANGFGAKLHATRRALKERMTWKGVCLGVLATIIVCHSVADVYRVCQIYRKEEKGPSRVRH